ncbi:ribonuclease [Janthinobacterium sp. 17J80-10]|uniref:ribonuclease domain-containing protein n=1 Tax=Janthinobacterium sp. 17J80-10 TaxID=2497863 RepID=UPI00100546AA|nr:ribonuclease [Janthinobacterium sp. 17J80-10]QAU35339.1 ribonuclease [Janthinobacterium sp. 17J80-10]
MKYSAMKFAKSIVFAFIALFFSLNVSARGPLPLETIAVRDLPVEARATFVLIKQGGPFPYSRDGVVFRNYEGILPKQKRGYYREYTVKTPGVRHRGARRIIAGGEPPPGEEFYYTDDHYVSFKRIRE